MDKINWLEEVIKRKEELIADLQGLLHIKSVLDEENRKPDAPFGEGVKEALLYMLEKGNNAGFQTKNLDNLAGHLEFGNGEQLLGILCHVDVVPEGDGWNYDPYGAEIHNGKIYARGALDDKGPTIAAFYAMKIVHELRLPLSKRVRMIIGTDEESKWRCVEHYFKSEEMPTIGFAPDADFPIIHAEKGMVELELTYDEELAKDDKSLFEVHSFHSGRRYNMVPDYAEVIMKTTSNFDDLIANFEQFLSEKKLSGQVEKKTETELRFVLKGVSAHAMEPNNGKNAGLYLAAFLAEQNIDGRAKQYFQFLTNYFFEDSRGIKLGINYRDAVSGDLTVNIGILNYEKSQTGNVGINIRYPVTYQFEGAKNIIDRLVQDYPFHVTHYANSEPHYVEESHPLIQTLQKVYERQTGEKAELLAIGGGTYARSLKAGVAFGPLFPGRQDVAHQKDEYMELEDLLKATAIYAEAIYELAK
ncbi:dipeptidase PepV [Bacillus kwashiorkori]|uniref:dipeptidase PepV n=1 Tax=Bacillus kwashiorkori TaxID=1522318 RepID=UPI000784660F|nr:dipeptidase PepV [Bacillus kwashiorkori]